MIFAEQIFGGVQIRRSEKLMLIHVCNQNPFTLIFRYYYSIEELGGRDGGGGGKKPSPKPGPKSGKNQAARPLRGAEVLGIWPDLYLFLEEIHRAGFLCHWGGGGGRVRIRSVLF